MKNRLFRQILPILFLILSLALTLSACTGPAGPAGESGTPGEPGAAGTGIEQAEINDKGELILTYTDGTKVNLGVIRPEASENPEDEDPILDFYPLPDGTYGVKMGKAEYLTTVTVPESYNGIAVTQILDSAFKNAKIRSIELPDSILSIGEEAFLGCASLSSVKIGNGVRHVGESAFRDCISLINVKLGESVTSIASSAFRGCNSLAKISIPASVTTVGDCAFYDCITLSELTLSEGLLSIGPSAFHGCTGLAEVELPDSLLTLGKGAFNGCRSLTSISASQANTAFSSEDGILYNKEKTEILAVPQNLIGTVSLPEGITSVGSGTFSGCTGITSVIFPESVTEIGSYAFNGCTTLASVVLPEDLTTIGEGAFYGCRGLVSISLGKGLSSVGSNAFSGCTGLRVVYYTGSESFWRAISIYPWGNEALSSATIFYDHVPTEN